MDELENAFNKLVGLWGVALGCGGVLIACHKRFRRWYRVVYRALRFSNAIHGHFGSNAATAIIESLSERTRDGAIREVRLTLLEESLGAGIYVCDHITGKCLNCNTALSDLFGIDQADFRDFGWLSAIVPDDRIAVYKRWAACVKNTIPYEYSYRVKNQRTGREFRVMTRAYPAVLRDGTLLCYVGTCEEINADK